MKVTALYGSPRPHGSSATLVKKAVAVFESAQAQVVQYHLNELNYKGCQGCLACKKKAEVCVVNDDLTKVLASIAQSDILVLSSPIYFGQITGQFKSFLDRTFSFLVPDFMQNTTPSRLAPGKKALFILTQGDVQEENFDIFQFYARVLNFYGYKTVELVRACGVSGEEDVLAKPDLLEKASQAAKNLLL